MSGRRRFSRDMELPHSSQTAGQVECGTSVEGNYAVIWTDNAKLRLAVVEGKNSASLYQWWRDKG
ncbi:hypothetical protein [Mycobacterium persicum]|uniref:hypothetical protein n=1 Tax=Mycobacterium persicum TaxID=1487726 RepID=UPI0015934FB6|nr:hypothetical protein [Mycobacterium persicum]